MADCHRRVHPRPAHLARDRRRRKTKAHLSAFAVGAVCLALGTACGGGDGAGDRLSAEEFREQANAICVEYNDKIAAIESPTSPENISDYVDTVIPVIEAGLADLRALNPPAEFEEDYDAMLDETAEAIPAARALSEAAADENAAAVQEAIAQGERADEASDRAATELALDSCASE